MALAQEEKFSEFIKRYREQNQLSIEELADMIMVSADKVRQWENEEAIPHESMVHKILTILKIDTTEDYTYY